MREERLSPRQSHGMNALKRAVKTLGSRAVDKRTAVGKALAAWRADLVQDLGGVENISVQQLALIEEAVTTKLILSSVNAWLLSQRTLVNRRSREVIAAVRDRNSLVTTLRGLLGDLGLERRRPEIPTLSDYLRGREAEPGAAGKVPEQPTVQSEPTVPTASEGGEL